MTDPITTATVATGAGAAAGTKLIEAVVTTLTTSLGSRFKLWKDKRDAAKRVATLYDKIGSLRNVKTIWQVDKEVDLHDFYHPTKVQALDGKTMQVHSLADLPEKGNIVLQGMVGLGKSILLRYLGSRELQIGSVVPIFVELRYRTSERSLNALLLERLAAWGFPATNEVLESLLQTGMAAVLCDAFDEVTDSLHAEVVHELEHLAERFPIARIIVTSRPDAPIQKSAAFRVVKLAELAKEDLPAIINRLEAGNERAERLISELDSMPAPVAEVAKTPLMVTLLVLSYRATNRLPETVSDFYETLFQTLLRRHDDTKPGYHRSRKTALSDHEIRRAFEAFCFFSRKQKIRVFEGAQAVGVATEAIAYAAINAAAEDYINDVKRITCLLLEEGGKHYFIHASVQEFFAACFLQRLGDGKAREFYSHCATQAMSEWTVELGFLRHLDAYRFAKHFELPLAETVIKSLFSVVPDQWKTPSKKGIQRLLDQCQFKTADASSPGAEHSRFGMLSLSPPVYWFGGRGA